MSRRYPDRPYLGVGALLFEGDSVLLVERGKPPLKGHWSIPGGVVEAGERLEDAVAREVLEETGLILGKIEFFTLFERLMFDPGKRIEYHYVLVDYLCEVAGGRLHPGDDVDRCVWTPRAELGRFEITEGTLEIIERAFAARSSERE